MTPPLTPRMTQCLAALLRLEAQRRVPATPNEIAYEAGFRDGGIRHGNGAARRGGWSGHMPPSNRVNFALVGLAKRGLVVWTHRRDTLSGMAIDLTAVGARTADAIPGAREKALQTLATRVSSRARFGDAE